MSSLHYEVDEVLQNKVVELAEKRLEWLIEFKQKNGGVDKYLDDEIEFQIEEMESYVSDYSRRQINKKCCERAVKELSEDLYYEMICHVMSESFRIALENKLNKEEYKKHGYYVSASCPYFAPNLMANDFYFDFNKQSIVGDVWYRKYTVKDGKLIDIREDAGMEVELSMEELSDWNGKRWRAISPILEDNRICFITYEKIKKDWNEIGEILWYIDEDKAIEKLSSLLKSLKDNKYKICVSHKGHVMYIYFDVKDDNLTKFALDSDDYSKEIGNRLIEKIKERI